MRRRRGVAQRPVPVVHRRLSPTPSATHRPQIPSEATDKEDSLSSENESNLPKEDRFPVPIVNQEEIARLRRKNALDILNSALGTSFDLDIAEKALDATQDVKSAEPEDWAEAAMVELAMQQETRQEYEKMGAAMQASLEEAEERKKDQLPLIKRAGKELEAEFNASHLLTSLTPCLGSKDAVHALLDNNKLHKSNFVEYLLMEQRCQRWYPCSRMYFMNSAVDLMQNLCTAQNNDNDTHHTSNAINGDGSGGVSENHKIKKKKIACRVDDGVIMMINSFVGHQVPLLQEKVYSRPPDTGSEGSIPALFAGLPLQPEELVLVEEEEHAVGRINFLKRRLARDQP